MSRIISPHGPTTILISFNEENGDTACRIVDGLGRTKELPVYQVCAIFAQLITQFLSDAARKNAFGPDNQNNGNAGGNAGGNTSEKGTKTNGQ